MDGVTIQTENLLELLPVIKFLGKRWIKVKWSLRPIPQIGSYHGLIFGTLIPDAVPLEEYLGDLKWYLDILVGRSGGMEVRGVPHRWIIPANWKSTMENFARGSLSCANITSINC